MSGQSCCTVHCTVHFTCTVICTGTLYIQVSNTVLMYGVIDYDYYERSLLYEYMYDLFRNQCTECWCIHTGIGCTPLKWLDESSNAWVNSAQPGTPTGPHPVLQPHSTPSPPNARAQYVLLNLLVAPTSSWVTGAKCMM